MKTHHVAGSVLFFSRAGVARTVLALYKWQTSCTAEANGRTNGAQRCSRRDSVPKRFTPPPGHCRVRTILATARGRGGGREKLTTASLTVRSGSRQRG